MKNPAQEGRGRGRFPVNISTLERVGRVVFGVAAAVVAIVLLYANPLAWQAALEVLLILAGLDLIVTGATGYCPLYHKLGHVSPTARGLR